MAMTRMSVSQSSWAGEGSSRSLPQKNLRFFFCFFIFLSFGLFSFDSCSYYFLFRFIISFYFIRFFCCWHRRYPAPPPSSHPKVSPQWLNPRKSLKVGQSRSRSRGTSICWYHGVTQGVTQGVTHVPRSTFHRQKKSVFLKKIAREQRDLVDRAREIILRRKCGNSSQFLAIPHKDLWRVFDCVQSLSTIIFTSKGVAMIW
jgi:hypothetical protein